MVDENKIREAIRDVFKVVHDNYAAQDNIRAAQTARTIEAIEPALTERLVKELKLKLAS